MRLTTRVMMAPLMISCIRCDGGVEVMFVFGRWILM
jgi:hypothetical protein